MMTKGKLTVADLLRYRFPDPSQAAAHGLVARTSTLDVAMLFSAYVQGIFPWSEHPVCWYSPDPRAVFWLDRVRLPSNLGKIIRKNRFSVTFDRCFSSVIQACALAHQDGGTWLSPGLQQVYCELHALGYAHSIEIWQGQRLVGGLYGVGIGHFFAGESMFSWVSNASKAAFAALYALHKTLKIELFDAQVANAHTMTLGVSEISRSTYLDCIYQLFPDEQAMFSLSWLGKESKIPDQWGFLANDL